MLGRLFVSKFADSGIKKELNTFFDSMSIADLNKGLLVTAYDTTMNTIRIFNTRNYTIDDPTSAYKLVDICLATSAAPTYFPPSKIPFGIERNLIDVRMIDGGIFANNPTLLALQEAIDHYDKFPYYRFDPESLESINIISIGTGKAGDVVSNRSSIINQGYFKWLLSNPNIITSCIEATSQYSEFMSAKYADYICRSTKKHSKPINCRIMRFQLPLSNSGINIDFTNSSRKNLDVMERFVRKEISQFNWQTSIENALANFIF